MDEEPLIHPPRGHPTFNIHHSFRALRKFVRERAPEEVCELCGARLHAEHQHLIDPRERRLLCCCDACAILFDGRDDARYRRVPD